MIGRLRGRVLSDEVEGVVLDVHGVGYEVTVPLGTLGRAPANDAGEVTLFVHTHVREDVFSLFGFATDTDRLAFRVLIGVSSVGPKTAIAVLSALPAGDLARAIAAKDVGKLTSIPGIGKKTAERLVLELRDKLPASAAVGTAKAGAGTGPGPVAPSAHGELLLSALVRMGYKAQEAERAVSVMGGRAEELPLPEALREALALLAK
jgi:Holliday junction DNA helicase RuvA